MTQRNVERMLRKAPLDAAGRRLLGNGAFEDVKFVGPIDFTDIRFKRANFSGATFLGDVRFDRAHFDELAEFACTTFEGTASFADAVFHCPANFEDRESEDPGRRRRSGEATFKRWADFREVTFESGASFAGALFTRRARFGGAIFGEPGMADGEPVASFVGARFERARTFGPMLVHGKLSLDRAAFEGPVRIEISAPNVSCVTTQFIGRTTLELRWATIDLEDAEFAQPSIVSRHLEQFELEDRPRRRPKKKLCDRAVEERGNPQRLPIVKSLKRANVGNLTLSDLNLKTCLFVGAHNLDGLRFEGADFPLVQNVWGFRRRAIREELDLPKKRPDLAERYARVYRALRKGREDNKDEPGAADFYYGEMEMRRKARRRRGETGSEKRTSRVEWLLLWAYRLVSGYGLRALRALFALVVLVLLATVLIQVGGFKSEHESAHGFRETLIFGFESSSSLFRGTSVIKGSELDEWGHVIQMVVRLFGALFLGLAILAVRGRVKR